MFSEGDLRQPEPLMAAQPLGNGVVGIPIPLVLPRDKRGFLQFRLLFLSGMACG